MQEYLVVASVTYKGESNLRRFFASVPIGEVVTSRMIRGWERELEFALQDRLDPYVNVHHVFIVSFQQL